jgi:hypothetical protein
VPENSPTVHEIVASHASSARAEMLQFSTFLDDRLSQLSIEMDEAVAAAGHTSRLAASEEFNQLLRRLKQCRSTEEVAAWLVDATSSYCGAAALFEVAGTTVRGVGARGFQLDGEESIEKLETPMDAAPALAHAVQERDTVIAIGSPAEVSPRIAAALGHAASEKVNLYPIEIQNRVVAILYATAGERTKVDGAALELLTYSAGSAAQILAQAVSAAPRSAEPELISIAGVDMHAHSPGSGVLLRQAREARARWFARAEAARLRLLHGAALERGRAQHDIYSALRPEIDSARRNYRQDFLAVSPAIPDYLHRELLSLAHHDESLLGPDYPGSLV